MSTRRKSGKQSIRSLARWQLVRLLTLKSWRKNVPEQELDRDYRSEQALTVPLMGMMAEERLGKLGRKRPALAGDAVAT